MTLYKAGKNDKNRNYSVECPNKRETGLQFVNISNVQKRNKRQNFDFKHYNVQCTRSARN